jgi:acyl-CoA thioester hydrolase
MASAPASTTIRSRIQWVDTDASGHYHFSTAFRLFEAAEAALFAALGLLSETAGRLPRVHASADFRSVLRFRDVVDVLAVVDHVGRSSVGIRFEIRREDELCAEGRFVAVLLTRAEGTADGWTPEQRELLLQAGPQPGEEPLMGDTSVGRGVESAEGDR